MEGSRIGIDFKGTATLADLKGLLQKNLGLPKDDQRFALVGQLLEDSRFIGNISSVPPRMLQSPLPVYCVEVTRGYFAVVA